MLGWGTAAVTDRLEHLISRARRRVRRLKDSRPAVAVKIADLSRRTCRGTNAALVSRLSRGTSSRWDARTCPVGSLAGLAVNRDALTVRAHPLAERTRWRRRRQTLALSVGATSLARRTIVRVARASAVRRWLPAGRTRDGTASAGRRIERLALRTGGHASDVAAVDDLTRRAHAGAVRVACHAVRARR